MHAPVRVAVDRYNPPFSVARDLDEALGFSVELIRQAFGHISADVEFVPVDGPMAQLLWLAAGRVDVAADITVTDRRRAWFAFSQWYHLEELMIFGRRDGALWPGFRSFHGRLAVKENSYVQEYLIRRYPRIPTVTTPSTESELEALRDGRASHIATTRETGLALIRDQQAADLVAEGTPFGPAPLALASLNTAPEFIELFDRGLSALRRDGTIEVLERRWLSAFAHS